MDQTDKLEFCLAYECPLAEVSMELKEVCNQLGDHCESCDQCFCCSSRK